MKNRRRRRYHYTTYLAGPMQAVSHSGAGWRVLFSKLLERYGVRVQNPVISEPKTTGMSITRTKNYLKALAPLAMAGYKPAKEKFQKIMKRIISSDFKMVDRSDFIVAQVIEGMVSSGTQSEIEYAAEKKIPVYVLYSGQPKNFPHWLLYFILISGGRVFREEKKHGFKECLNFIRSRFELDALERNSRRRIAKKAVEATVEKPAAAEK
jgi:nucleoside 2-deoxyribosyltransferase